MLRTRPYRDSDLADVVELWTKTGLVIEGSEPRRDIDRCRASRRGEIFLALSEDRLVGTLMVGHDAERGWLHFVAVALDARRSGIGQALVERACEWLKEQAMTYVSLMVRPDH